MGLRREDVDGAHTSRDGLPRCKHCTYILVLLLLPLHDPESRVEGFGIVFKKSICGHSFVNPTVWSVCLDGHFYQAFRRLPFFTLAN